MKRLGNKRILHLPEMSLIIVEIHNVQIKAVSRWKLEEDLDQGAEVKRLRGYLANNQGKLTKGRIGPVDMQDGLLRHPW